MAISDDHIFMFQTHVKTFVISVFPQNQEREKFSVNLPFSLLFSQRTSAETLMAVPSPGVSQQTPTGDGSSAAFLSVQVRTE